MRTRICWPGGAGESFGIWKWARSTQSKRNRLPCTTAQRREENSMALSGRYAEDAKRSYKTVEGRQFLAAVRDAICRIDEEMEQPSSNERGKRIAIIAGALEFAAD